MSTLWLLCSLALMAGGVSTMEDCSYHRLQDHLGLSQINESTTGLRPVVHWTNSTLVMVDMILFGIMDLNEKSSTFTSYVLISTAWVNYFIAWEPKEFCGISKMTVPRERVWIPDIGIQEDISDTSSTILSPYVQVHHNWLAQVIDQRRLTTSCKMDLYRFPLDTQSCSITFKSMIHRASEIKLRAFASDTAVNHITRESMTTLDEWDFLGIAMTEEELNYGGDEKWHQLIYKINLRRRPLLYIINLVVPIAFFLVLDLASFFVSEAKGEKLGFKVTILLSISVLLLILNDILPSTANNLPVIAIYCIVIFALTGLSLLETMLMSFLIDMDSRVYQDVQTSAKTCEETQEETECRREPERDAESSLEKVDTFNKKDLDGNWLNNPYLLQLILKEVQNVRQEWFSVNVRCGKEKPGYWEKVARRIDQAYFCLYLITTISFLIFISFMWLH
uniref:5-hydroxytryptamine receptor 3A-like isoform X1 n=1 Tax=Oncorhynchus gorbuscha TaxID=8017 RepID=UPI001EAF4C9B|nr:5-hydroxytryptamine receptor 3A-like isoform X1 [Oncorhynchus gorbuscha]